MATSLEDQPKRPDERRAGAAIRPAAAIAEEWGVGSDRPEQAARRARRVSSGAPAPGL
jgi:hypothetical protein